MKATIGQAGLFAAALLAAICCGGHATIAQTQGVENGQAPGSVQRDLDRLRRDLGQAGREQLRDLANRVPRFFRLHEREIAMVAGFLPEELRSDADIFVDLFNRAILSARRDIGRAGEKIKVYVPENLLHEISERGFTQAVADYYDKNCEEFGKPSLYWSLNQALLDEIEIIESDNKSKRERTCRMIQVAVAAYPAIGMAILNGGS